MNEAFLDDVSIIIEISIDQDHLPIFIEASIIFDNWKLSEIICFGLTKDWHYTKFQARVEPETQIQLKYAGFHYYIE